MTCPPDCRCLTIGKDTYLMNEWLNMVTYLPDWGYQRFPTVWQSAWRHPGGRRRRSPPAWPHCWIGAANLQTCHPAPTSRQRHPVSPSEGIQSGETVRKKKKMGEKEKGRRRRWEKKKKKKCSGEWAEQSSSMNPHHHSSETERRSVIVHWGWVTDLQHCLVWADVTFCAPLSAIHSSIYIGCWATPKLSSKQQTHERFRLPCCVKHHIGTSTESPIHNWAQALSLVCTVNVSVL